MISVTFDLPGEDVGPQWDELVTRASSNAFMNPAAVQAVRDTGFARIVTMLAWEQGQESRKLVGAWALQLRKAAPLLPAVLEALPYKYAFLSNPVVDPAFADDVIAAFFAAIESNADLPNAVSLTSFDAETPSHAAMLKMFSSRGIEPLTFVETTRPFVTREFGVKRSGSTRKKLRQDWNRLSALGTVEVVNDRDPASVAQAFETLLAMEKASWKGEQGTAMLSDAHDAAFVRRLLHNLAARGDASVALLRLDGEAIAAQVLMYGGSTAYTWKIAYDAKFAKFSPGTLLVDRITDALFAGPDVAAINSCAAEDSFMGQLWAGRRNMVDMLIDIGPGKSFGYHVEAGRQFAYHRLRNLRNRLRNRPSPRPKPEISAAS